MAEAGRLQDVNIGLGDDVSAMLYEASKQTHNNRPGLLVEFHRSFSGFRAIPLDYFKDPKNLLINLGFDGVGTKVEVAERMDDHSTTAFDLVAMVADDAVVRGAEPIALGSIVDVRRLKDNEHTRRAIEQLALGYVAAASAANVVVVNGETAELGDRIGGYAPFVSFMQKLQDRVLRRAPEDISFNYNWGAAVLWVAHKERILTGHQIEPGDALVGLVEPGFRSNGITDVRIAMRQTYGKEWHYARERSLGDVVLGRLVQTPSTIYAGLVNELTGGFDIEKEPKAEIHGIAHITGGGQPSKLGRMLEPSGLGATINNPINPPEVMLHIQRLREFSDEKAYGKWHMGPGMVIATPEPERVIAEALLRGIEAKEIGYITEKPGIKIKNRGAQQQQEWLKFAA